MPARSLPPHYVVDPATGCWLWAHSKNPLGYGNIHFQGRSTSAHRYVYGILDGRDVPKGIDVCHKCDNPPCVNPDHMFLGTRKDNMQDMLRKGRYRKPPPGAHKKISDADAAVIRRRVVEGGESQTAIARELGYGQSTIRYIVHQRQAVSA